jgi:hypothetical protein
VNGYPVITQHTKNLVYDSVQLNARRSGTLTIVCADGSLQHSWHSHLKGVMAVNKALATKPYYDVKSEADATLVFDSLFESGECDCLHICAFCLDL